MIEYIILKYKKLKYVWNWPSQLELVLIFHTVFKFSQLNAYYKNGKPKNKNKSTPSLLKLLLDAMTSKWYFLRYS